MWLYGPINLPSPWNGDNGRLMCNESLLMVGTNSAECVVSLVYYMLPKEYSELIVHSALMEYSRMVFVIVFKKVITTHNIYEYLIFYCLNCYWSSQYCYRECKIMAK